MGYMFALGYAVLPRLVPELRRTLPDVELQFVEMSARTYEGLISDFKVTVGLCMPPLLREGIVSAPVGNQPLLLAMPTRAAMARHAAVPMQKLQGIKLIGLPSLKAENTADASLVAALLRRNQVTVQIVERVETVHSALALVLFRPLQGENEGIDVAVCWRRDLDSPLVKPFIAAVRSVMR